MWLKEGVDGKAKANCPGLMVVEFRRTGREGRMTPNIGSDTGRILLTGEILRSELDRGAVTVSSLAVGLMFDRECRFELCKRCRNEILVGMTYRSPCSLITNSGSHDPRLAPPERARRPVAA